MNTKLFKQHIKNEIRMALEHRAISGFDLSAPLLSESCFSVTYRYETPKAVKTCIAKFARDIKMAKSILIKNGKLVSECPKHGIYAYLWHYIRSEAQGLRAPHVSMTVAPFLLSKGIKEECGIYIPFYLLTYDDSEALLKKLHGLCKKVAKKAGLAFREYAEVSC